MLKSEYVGFQQMEFILNSELFAAQVTHGGDLVLHVSVDNMSNHTMFWELNWQSGMWHWLFKTWYLSR